MTVLDCAKELSDLMNSGRLMEAFEKYYHVDVELVEATGESFKGKDLQRQRLVDWMSGIEELHASGTRSITANEESGVAMLETWTDATFKQGGRFTFEEVQVQQWKDGQIVHERFYYNMPG